MFFTANERTFLGWLSMAVTIGSVSAALVGFTASEEKGETLYYPLIIVPICACRTSVVFLADAYVSASVRILASPVISMWLTSCFILC